jgi:transposase
MQKKSKSEKKNVERERVLKLVVAGKVTLEEAARRMGVSGKQAKRVYEKYAAGGIEALKHGNVGRRPVNKSDEGKVAKATALYEEKYNDFGPTFAAEKLEEVDGVRVGVSVFRRALIEKGLWTPSKESSEHRSRRAPKEHFGEMVQFDGSPHDWFEHRRMPCCLITMIDDAKKERLSQFFEQETMFGTMTVLKMWILKYGIPLSLYCDKKNAFVLTREPTNDEILHGILHPKSHFGRACDKLGIEVIPADSAQGKGRVERNHGVDQDRLIKEMRLAGISTIPDANKFLLDYYLPKMNAKFGRPAKSNVDFHVPAGNADLDNILCREFERCISKDYIIRFEGRLFQVLAKNKPLPMTSEKVIVREWLDHSIHIFWKDKPLLFTEVSTMFDD